MLDPDVTTDGMETSDTDTVIDMKISLELMLYLFNEYPL